jgi:uncharacterized protein YecE (DUF72 family)
MRTLKDYYKEKMEAGSKFKEQILKELEISNATFYNLLNNNSFTKLQWEKIQEITGEEFEREKINEI